MDRLIDWVDDGPHWLRAVKFSVFLCVFVAFCFALALLISWLVVEQQPYGVVAVMASFVYAVGWFATRE